MDQKAIKNDMLLQQVDSQFRRTYAPLYAWADAVAAHMMIPGLRGFWPMSAIGDSVSGTNSLVTDLSSQGRHLTNTGVAGLRYEGLVPTYYFDGTNDYFSRADENGLDITGAETYIASTIAGLTLGGWFRLSAINPASNKAFMAKWNDNGVNQRSYLLYLIAGTATPQFLISSTGIAGTSSVTGVALSVATWHHIVGRFDPSTQVSVFVDGEPTSAVSADAAIFNSNADFNIMAHNNGLASTRNNGYPSLCFLSTCYLSDGVIKSIYHSTRALFGK